MYLSLFVSACTGQKDAGIPHAAVVANTFRMDRERAKDFLAFLTQAPHPFGSERQREVKSYMMTALHGLGVEAVNQEFSVRTPSREFQADLRSTWTTTRQGYNVTAFLELVPNPTCVIGLASHYDTKDIDGFAYLGANDGGSSSILLFELAVFLKSNGILKTNCDVQVIWFDGEESVLPQWNDGITTHPSGMQDNTYGSRHFVDFLQSCPNAADLVCVERRGTLLPFRSLILLDMIGYETLKLTQDQLSHPQLKAILAQGAKILGKSHLIGDRVSPIEDDHIPFKKRGVPALNIIDFNHENLWHTPSDLPHTVSMQSLEDVGRLALYVVHTIGEAEQTISLKEES